MLNSSTAAAAPTAAGLDHLLLSRQIEDFLYFEARLLDERQFEQWFDLLTEDVRIWMPLRRNVKFGEWEREDSREGQDLGWFEDDKKTIRQRVTQLLTGIHWVEEPISRVTRSVTNVRVVSASPSEREPAEVVVQSCCITYRNRSADETYWYVGNREDVLRKVGGQWQIARRKLLLNQNVLQAKDLAIFF